MRPKLVILQPRKKFQVLEKNVFSKKQQQQKKFTPIFLNKSTKNLKNSAERSGDKYSTNHLVEFLQDRIKS